MKRFLIPIERQIVVLDTSPVRNIAEGTEPDWVATFARMRKDGYVFCLADGAWAELLAQRCQGRISDDGHQRMIAALRLFIDPEVPVLLGKRDVVAMLGLQKQQKRWSAKDVKRVSQEGWSRLVKAKPDDPHAGLELDEERSDYRSMFKRLEEAWEASDKSVALHEYTHPQLDLALKEQRTHGRIRPDTDVRNDLLVRWLWRQFVRSQRTKEAYDPESPKKRNDGIDFDLYRYLALPAFVVSTDEGFLKKIEDIDSPQKSWFWKPEDLAAAYKDGEVPLTYWAEK